MKTILPSLLLSFPKVTSFFTTRMGGVSLAPYTDANLAFHVGDDPLHVLENHTRLAQKMEYDHHRLIHMRQIHSDHIVLVTDALNFDTPPECDALITNRLNTPLMVMSADCTPILLYDPINHACAAIHAGRAGALNEILPKTITAMYQNFGSSASDIHAILGPSIHGCCYEINPTIADETRVRGYADALHYEGEKIFLDVNTVLTHQLKQMGVTNTEIINECTACHHEKYFSYRADQQHTGRIAGVIILR